MALLDAGQVGPGVGTPVAGEDQALLLRSIGQTGFDLGQYLALDALKERQLALANLIEANPLTASVPSTSSATTSIRSRSLTNNTSETARMAKTSPISRVTRTLHAVQASSRGLL